VSAPVVDQTNWISPPVDTRNWKDRWAPAAVHFDTAYVVDAGDQSAIVIRAASVMSPVIWRGAEDGTVALFAARPGRTRPAVSSVYATAGSVHKGSSAQNAEYQPMSARGLNTPPPPLRDLEREASRTPRAP
jgi:hypothetical protein